MSAWTALKKEMLPYFEVYGGVHLFHLTPEGVYASPSTILFSIEKMTQCDIGFPCILVNIARRSFQYSYEEKTWSKLSEGHGIDWVPTDDYDMKRIILKEIRYRKMLLTRERNLKKRMEKLTWIP